MTGLAGVTESRRSAYDMVLGDVRAEVARRDLNPGSDSKLIQTITASHVAAWQDDTVQGKRGDAEAFADVEDVAWRIFKDVVSFGSVLEELMARPDVEEIYGRDGELTYRLTSGEIEAVPYPVSAAGNLTVVQRLLADAGEQIDSSHPRADGVRVFLPGGRRGRLTASIAPRIDGIVAFTLRLPQKHNATLSDMVSWGSLTAPAANFLAVLMLVPRIKILVVGPPGAGKTTLLDGLLRAVDARVRVIVCEENRELSAPLLNGEYWATSKVETLDILLRSARVGSPELLCLGELKGREAWDLVLAGNLGTGLLAAVHADSVPLGFESLATAAAPAVPAMSPDHIRDKFARTFEVVVFVDMATVAGRAVRKVTEISVVPPQLSAVAVAVTPIFLRDDLDRDLELKTASLTPELARRCDRALTGRHITVTDVLKSQAVL
jgi:Flp pilus assembly CpaF family ATPase